MKKLFIIVAIVFISTTAFAQFGITGGATLASVKIEDQTSSLNQSTDSKLGFTAGVFTSFPLSTNFIFRPGLNYTQKGGKVNETEGTLTSESKITLNYIELPLDFIYKAAGGFFVGAGPALAYGLSGKTKYSITGGVLPGQNTSGEDKINFGSDANNDDLKRFEFSGNLLAGYQLSNGIFLSVNYNLGFSDLSLDNDITFKNRYFGIRLGYMLGGAGE